MIVEGACHCGYVTYRAEIDPDKTSICHCTDCQTLSGSPYRASVPAPPGSFELLSGEPAIYVKMAESGNKRAQAFCPKCGSPLYATSPDEPDGIKMLRLGTLKQRDELVPKRQVWARSRQTWVDHLTGISAIEKQS